MILQLRPMILSVASTQRPVMLSERLRKLSLVRFGLVSNASKALIAAKLVFGTCMCLMAAPVLQQAWLARYNNSNSLVSAGDSPAQMAVDTAGNMYVTGQGANGDIVTVKHSPSGTTLWASVYNGEADLTDQAIGLVVDDASNVYVTGRSLNRSNSWDIVTLKYGPGGQQLWVDRLPGMPTCIRLDAQGAAYVAGVSGPDYLLLKFDGAGNRAWTLLRTNSFAPYGAVSGYAAMVFDKSGNLYLTGAGGGASQTTKYNPSGNEAWTVNYANYGGSDLALDINGFVYVVGNTILKYSSDGSLVWSRNETPVYWVKVSPSGNVYASTVLLTQTTPQGHIGYGHFTYKFAPTGIGLWTNKVVELYPNVLNPAPRPTLMVIDEQENVYIAAAARNPLAGTRFDYWTIKYSPVGSQLWLKAYDGPGNGDDHPASILYDGQGSIYVTGSSSATTPGFDYATLKYRTSDGATQATARYDSKANGVHEAITAMLDGDGNICVAGNSFATNNLSDYAVLKFTPSGTQLWASRYNSPSNTDDRVRAMTLDSNGNIYVTGTAGTVKFTGSGEQEWVAPYAGKSITADTSNHAYVAGLSASNIAVVKLTPGGIVAWYRTMDPSPGADESPSVSVDADGNVFLPCRYGTWCDRGGCYYQLGMVKYSPAGDLVWFSNTPPTFLYSARIVATALDSAGRPLFTCNPYPSASPFFTVKFDQQGARLWAFPGYGNQSAEATAMAITADDKIYLTGSSGFQAGNYLTFKLDVDGGLLWSTNYVGEASGSSTANAIAVDAFGNAYVTGVSPGVNTGNDIVTVQYDSQGRQQRVLRFSSHAAKNDAGRAILVDRSGSVYVAGYANSSGNATDLLLIKYAPLDNILRRPDGMVELQFFGTEGQEYLLQASTNLVVWEALTSARANSSGVVQFTDASAVIYPHRFYRLSAQ